MQGLVYFGRQPLPNTLVHADNLDKFTDFHRQENIRGITGNTYLRHNVVIIDYKNRVFGVQ